MKNTSTIVMNGVVNYDWTLFYFYALHYRYVNFGTRDDVFRSVQHKVSYDELVKVASAATRRLR